MLDMKCMNGNQNMQKTYSFMISRETWVSGNIGFLINFIEFKLYQVQLV